MQQNSTGGVYIQQLSDKLAKLSSRIYFNTLLTMDKPVTLLMIEYQLECERKAQTFAEHQEVQQAELSHRYFKALKLAGSYAFIDNSPEILEEHYYAAMKLVEDSGRAFDRILTRDRNYVRLAKYIASTGHEVTQADIQEDLPFYKGGEGHRRDLLNLAIAWGYKNNIIIKKTYADGIEFLSGESLKKTNLNKLIVSYSQHIATDYENTRIAWGKISTLFTAPGYHWINHHLREVPDDAA